MARFNLLGKLFGKNGKAFMGDIVGRTLVVNGKTIIEGTLAKVESSCDVTVNGDVAGNVTGGMSVTCGNVTGDVEAEMSVTCKDVGGDVEAGMSIDARTINGSAKAGMSITTR